LLLTLISAALINNLVLHWPLGVDPLLASSAAGACAGLATTCLMLSVGIFGYR
jgi:electron transport complex protein RnfA